MNDKDEALSLEQTLRLALEAMKIKQEVTMWANDGDRAKFNKAITAIKAALLSRSDGEAKDEPIQKQIIKIKTIEEPCNQVMALGQMMRDWLQSQIADSNTSVDVGKGLSEFDLWVQCEGKELFITIKEKK